MPRKRESTFIRWRNGWAFLDYPITLASGAHHRHREALGLTDPAKAAKKAGERIAELERNEQIKRDQSAGRLPKPSELSEQTLLEAITAWTENYRLERRKRGVPDARINKNLSNIAYANRIVLARFGGCPTSLDGMDEDRVDTFVARGGEVVISTIGPRETQALKLWLSSVGYGGAEGRGLDQYFVHLRRVLHHAELQDVVVRKIAWHRLGLISEERPASQRIMTPDEEAKIIGALNEDAVRVVRLGVLTLMREENLFGLRWSDIKEDDEGRSWMYFLQKGSRPHKVPVLAEEQEILDACRGHHPEFVLSYLCRLSRTIPSADGTTQRRHAGVRYPWTPRGFRNHWLEALAAAGIEDKLTFHWATRATGASRARRRGAPTASVMRRGGWVSTRVFQRYDRVTESEVAQDIISEREAHAANGELSQDRRTARRFVPKIVASK